MNISAFNPAHAQQKLQERFNNGDTDESGSLSLDEMLANAPEDVSKDKVEAMFARLDTDGSGEISQEEHKAMIEQMSQRMESLSGYSAKGVGTFDTTSSLLESLQSTEEEESTVQDLVEKLKESLSESNNDEQALRQSLKDFTAQYPRINTSV
ncbi:MAG: EF-hand domain-containing protein [Psychrobium sp.]